METANHAWWNFGYTGIFLCVFIEQLGLPLPALAVLIGAGALVASGSLSLVICFLVALVACLIADTLWYEIGRRKGRMVLYLLCKLSWKPDVCAIKTKIAFNRRGTLTLVFGKFVPALGVLAPPMAGMAGVSMPSFLAYDGLGSAIYVLLPLAFGAYLQKTYEQMTQHAHMLFPYLPWICGCVIVIGLLWRFLYRRRYRQVLLEGLKDAVTAPELRSFFELGHKVTVVDVRDEVSAAVRPHFLPKALHVPLNLLKKARDIPVEDTLIIYCDCPNDQASVEAVNMLKKRGATKVRPLRGGLQGWINAGYEIDRREARVTVEDTILKESGAG